MENSTENEINDTYKQYLNIILAVVPIEFTNTYPRK